MTSKCFRHKITAWRMLIRFTIWAQIKTRIWAPWMLMPKKTKSLNKGTCSFYTKKIFDGIYYVARYSCILKFIPLSCWSCFCAVIAFYSVRRLPQVKDYQSRLNLRHRDLEMYFLSIPVLLWSRKGIVHAKDTPQGSRRFPVKSAPSQNGLKTEVESATYFKLNKTNYVVIWINIFG